MARHRKTRQGRSLPSAPRRDPYVPDSGVRLPPRVGDGEAGFWPGIKAVGFGEPVGGRTLDPAPKSSGPSGRDAPEPASPEFGDAGVGNAWIARLLVGPAW